MKGITGGRIKKGRHACGSAGLARRPLWVELESKIKVKIKYSKKHSNIQCTRTVVTAVCVLVITICVSISVRVACNIEESKLARVRV